MFDIGFSEIVLIAVVALVVIGPERLPKVARTAGLLFGRFQRYVGSVRGDVERELQLEEFKRAAQAANEGFQDAIQATRDTLVIVEESVNTVVHQTAISDTSPTVTPSAPTESVVPVVAAGLPVETATDEPSLQPSSSQAAVQAELALEPKEPVS
ncbi:MAG: Sec-independent protein translocase protein TatB [Betaproteobacteria bacterium]|nr:Sec-independent protein translocase protein TatB [Betaproteobacteria bacterium]